MPERRYFAAIPRHAREWIRHQDRWPGWHRDAIAGQRDTPGPAGDRLSPHHRAEARDTISRVRKAEPRVSAAMTIAERDNADGARLVGFEHRFKGDDRLTEKIAEELRHQPDNAVAEVVRRIPDAIRYTFCLSRDRYVAGFLEIAQRLEAMGYRMYRSRNFWDDPEYKGINTRWVTADGVRFEVQFHTPESFHAKEHLTHQAYERLRDHGTGAEERTELREYQRAVTSCIPVPDGVTRIPGSTNERVLNA